MAAIVGSSGLMPTYSAAEAGKTVLLANKEALVMSGALFMSAVANGEGEVIPVDSEHNAIFQCLGNERTVGLEVAKILLTGSGGRSVAGQSLSSTQLHPKRRVVILTGPWGVRFRSTLQL